MEMILTNLLLPVSVSIVVAFLTSKLYLFLNEGERKSKAIHSSVQLWIGQISGKELRGLSKEQCSSRHLMMIDSEDEQYIGYKISLKPLYDVFCELTDNQYKVLRFHNIGEDGAVMRQIIHSLGSSEKKSVLQRDERYLIESGAVIYLYVRVSESPNRIDFDYPRYKLIFDDINLVEPYIRVPKVIRYKK